MVNYKIDMVHYPQENVDRMVLEIQEGDYIGTNVMIENFGFSSDDASEMDVTYSIIDNPLNIEENNEEFVAVFSDIMIDVVNQVVKQFAEDEGEV